jgi:hypothetical protein
MFAFSGTCTPIHMQKEEKIELLYQSSCTDGEQIADCCHYSNLGSMIHEHSEIETQPYTMLLKGKSISIKLKEKVHMYRRLES